MAGRRSSLGRSCWPSVRLCSLQRASLGRRRGAEAPKGGTLRLGSGRTSTSSIRRLPTDAVVAARLRHLREALQLSGRAGCGGNAGDSGGRSRRPRSRATAATYVFDLKRTFRFHTGAAVTARSFADAFNRVANPRLQSPANGVHARDRRRRRRHGGEGAGDLGRPRAWPLPAADPADQAGRRLHRPADAALLLSDPAEHAGRPGRDRTIRPARARTTSPSGS